MNGVWIRSEDGRRLIMATDLYLWETDDDTWTLSGSHGTVADDETVMLGSYDTEDEGLRQLDDIHKWMQAGTEYRIDESNSAPYIYDLRERKVKEDAE